VHKQTIKVQRVSGKGRGKNLGIPTLNFVVPTNLKLPYGIYAGWLTTAEKKYQTAIHFGPRPTFNEIEPSLEAYILEGFIENVPKDLELEFVQRIRDIHTFNFETPELMINQINHDIKEVKKTLVPSP